MIAIIDYDSGNICSVKNAIERLGEKYIVTSDYEAITQASHLILPGVGAAPAAMEKLSQRGLDKFIPTLKQPVLGICIGMQLMCRESEETVVNEHDTKGVTQCMGIFDTKVVSLAREIQALQSASPSVLSEDKVKVPHMGWNNVMLSAECSDNQTYSKDGGRIESDLFKGISSGSFFYYVHSFAPEICSQTIAYTDYGGYRFSAALRSGNFFGTQFHPEKSSDVGERLLRNFLKTK